MRGFWFNFHDFDGFMGSEIGSKGTEPFKVLIGIICYSKECEHTPGLGKNSGPTHQN